MKELLILGGVLAISVFLVHAQTIDVCADCVSYAPDPESCCFYYSCLGGSGGVRLACPPGLHFNPKLLVCDWPYRANCTANGEPATPVPTTAPPTVTTPTTVSTTTTTPVPTTTTTTTTTPVPTTKPTTTSTPVPTTKPTTPTTTASTAAPTTQPGIIYPCTSTDPATLPYPDDCTKYYYCYEGKPYVVQCDNLQYFSEPDHGCIFASECPSGGGGVTPPGVTYPCTSTDPATLPYPDDCAKYYYCHQGYPYVVQCEKGQFFSEPDHACIVASECPSGGGGTGGTVFKCPDEYGTYVYPGDTTRYYYCYQSIPYTVQCYKDQHYDSTIHACALNN